MGYARPERRFRREMLRQMDRVAVAGDFGEADHVGRIDGLLECLRHADREVLKIKHLQRQHFMALRVIKPAAGPGRRPVILAPCTSPRSMVFWVYYNHSFGCLPCCSFGLPSVSSLSRCSASPCR